MNEEREPLLTEGERETVDKQAARAAAFYGRITALGVPDDAAAQITAGYVSTWGRG